MNIEDGDAVHQSIAAADFSAPEKAGSKRRKGHARGRVVPGFAQPAGDSLTRGAKRLLGALGQPETWAFVDPTDPLSVLIHRRRGGVSVGAGRFAAAAADALVHEDLACWQQTGSGRRTLQLTSAGQARLRRMASPDAGLAFLHQHRETEAATVETATGTTRVRIDTEESPLAWLRRRRDRSGEPMIDETAYQAGERLRTDIMLAGLLPGVTARWDAMPRTNGPASPGETTDRMVAARQRLRHAFDAVGGDVSDLLLDLCGFLKGLEQIERERQWPARSAKVVIRLALGRLAEHYGIERKHADRPPRGASAHGRQW